MSQSPPPEAPGAAQMFSMLAPLMGMYFHNTYLKDDERFLNPIRFFYIATQFFAIAVYAVIFMKVKQNKEKETKEEKDGKKVEKIQLAAVVQMGTEVEPAKEVTPSEYDDAKLKKNFQEVFMSFGILLVIHYKWETSLPLTIQALTVPTKLFMNPLFSAHILGRDVKRPFAEEPNPMKDLIEKSAGGGETAGDKKIENKPAASASSNTKKSAKKGSNSPKKTESASIEEVSDDAKVGVVQEVEQVEEKSGKAGEESLKSAMGALKTAAAKKKK